MKEILLVIISQIFAAFVGRSVITLFFRREIRSLPLFERAAVFYVLGAGFIPLYMLALHLAGAGFTINSVYIIPAIFCAVSEIITRSLDKKEPRANPAPAAGRKMFSGFEYLFILFIIFEAAHSFFRAMIEPISSFDSVASFAVKSKVFFLSAGIPPDFFTNIGRYFPHPFYPMMTPLQETFSFIAMGSFNDLLVKIIYPAHFLALIILAYYALRSVTGRLEALIFTFLLCSMNELNRFSCVGYTDIHFAIYLSIGIIFFYRALVSGGRRNIMFFFISAVFAAFAMFTKDMGFIAPVICFLLLAMRPGNIRAAKQSVLIYLFYFAVMYLTISPWLILKSSAGIQQEFVQKSVFSPAQFVNMAFARLPAVLYELQTNIFGIKKWNILWPVFIVLYAANFKATMKTHVRYITWSILLIALAYLLFYITVDVSVYGTGPDYAQSLRAGMNRHLIHIVPLVIMWLAFIFRKS